MSATPPTAELRFADECGLLFENDGLPRIAGRVLGWLLVCDPPAQSLADLTSSLGISKASASTVTRLLIAHGFVDRTLVPGDRRDHYLINEAAWARIFEMRTGTLRGLVTMAEKGLRMLHGAPPERRSRLEAMHRLYSFLARELPALLVKFRDEEAARAKRRGNA